VNNETLIYLNVELRNEVINVVSQNKLNALKYRLEQSDKIKKIEEALKTISINLALIDYSVLSEGQIERLTKILQMLKECVNYLEENLSFEKNVNESIVCYTCGKVFNGSGNQAIKRGWVLMGIPKKKPHWHCPRCYKHKYCDICDNT